MEREERLELLTESSLSDFLDGVVELESDIGIPRGLKVHCPDGCDVEEVAADIKAMIDDEISALLDSARESLEEDQELDGCLDVYSKVEGNDIVFDFRGGTFEVYGPDVELCEDLFDLGLAVNEALKSAAEKYPGLTFEGLVSWTQYWGQAYVSYALLCNKLGNEYAKEIILEDDGFWDDYEAYADI